MAYSASYKKHLASLSPTENPLILLEISHSGLATPVRVVNDLQAVTSGALLYSACGFKIVLPNQPGTGATEAKLEIDNVGRELMTWLEASNGGRGSTVKISQILRSAPNTVEYSVTLFLTNLQVNASTVSGTLSFTDIFNKECFPTRYTVTTAPGLF